MEAIQEIREVDGINVVVEISGFVYEKDETLENMKEALNNTFLFLEDEAGENTLDMIKENEHWVNCNMNINVDGEDMDYYAVVRKMQQTKKYAIAFDNAYDSVSIEIMTNTEFKDRFGCDIDRFNDIVNNAKVDDDTIDGVYQISYMEVTA